MQPLSGLVELMERIPRVATQNSGASQPLGWRTQSLWDWWGRIWFSNWNGFCAPSVHWR